MMESLLGLVSEVYACVLITPEFNVSSQRRSFIDVNVFMLFECMTLSVLNWLCSVRKKTLTLWSC